MLSLLCRRTLPVPGPLGSWSAREVLFKKECSRLVPWGLNVLEGGDVDLDLGSALAGLGGMKESSDSYPSSRVPSSGETAMTSTRPWNGRLVGRNSLFSKDSSASNSSIKLSSQSSVPSMDGREDMSRSQHCDRSTASEGNIESRAGAKCSASSSRALISLERSRSPALSSPRLMDQSASHRPCSASCSCPSSAESSISPGKPLDGRASSTLCARTPKANTSTLVRRSCSCENLSLTWERTGRFIRRKCAPPSASTRTRDADSPPYVTPASCSRNTVRATLARMRRRCCSASGGSSSSASVDSWK